MNVKAPVSAIRNSWASICLTAGQRSSSLVSQREVGRCVRSAALRQSVQVISASVVCRQQQSPINRPRSEPLKVLNITLNLHILYILYTNCAALRVQDSWRRTSSTPQNKSWAELLGESYNLKKEEEERSQLLTQITIILWMMFLQQPITGQHWSVEIIASTTLWAVWNLCAVHRVK